MTLEEKKYIEAMSEMINTQGWKFFCEEASAQMELSKDQISVYGMTNEKIAWTQGYIACLNTVISLERRIKLLSEVQEEG